LNVETGEAPGREERMWAMLCHLSAFAFFLLPPIGGVLGWFAFNWLIDQGFSGRDNQHPTSWN
jgi:uncharacterized Tic20 family protein